MAKEYKYTFATNEVDIVEVSDEWAAVLNELDREEYNNDHSETRRHCSLDALNLDGAYLPSDYDLFTHVIARIEKERLYEAISKLAPQQRALLLQVFFGNRRITDIASEQGVTRMAINNRMNKIYAALEKNMK